MTLRLATLSVLLLALGAGCFDYDDTTAEPDTGVSDTGADDIAEGDVVEDTEDETSDAVADVGEPLPTYVETACDARTPVNGPTEITHPACDYATPYQTGLVGITESCGEGADAPVGVHLSFPTEDASRNMAVLWSTPDTTRETLVRLGDSPENLDRLYWGHNFTYAALTDRVIHEVHLCGLEPGRTYYYQAGSRGAWSDVYAFSTAPEADTEDEIVFAVTGDTRSDTFAQWASVVEQIRDHGAEFIVFSGDAVEAGPAQYQWDGFFTAGQPGLAEIPLIPANGNHDLLVSPWYGQFALGRDEINFSVRYGPLFVTVLTDFYPQGQAEIGGSFAQYLDDALTQNSDAAWKFLTNHRPFYSASTRHGSALDLRADWGPIVDKHEVDMVFNGHDHNYERSRPIRGEEVVNFGEGTIFTVIAGVGAPLYDNGQDWWTETSEKTSPYAIIRVQGDTLEFTAYRDDGTELDAFTWTR